MDFRQILINGIVYGKVSENDEKYIKSYTSFPSVTNVDFHDRNLIDIINDPHHRQHKHVKHAIFFLALCHTVVAENRQNEVFYNASSPDELALVNFAKFCGVEFRGLQNDYLVVKFQGNEHRFRLLQNFEFTSSRKRQSIIFETEENEIFLYTKGADSVVKSLLSSTMNHEMIEYAVNELKAFGCEGLRTLVLAEKKLTINEYNEWLKEYEIAKKSLNRKLEKMEDLQEKMEKKLKLIGATAIHDKLQDGVPETIQALREAGLKVWVLTGDKIETAINIGYSCGLLNNMMGLCIIEDEHELQLVDSFERYLKTIDQVFSFKFPLLLNKLNKQSSHKSHALVIAGDSLIQILIKKYLCDKMIKLCEKCSSVICCRVSPKQKQEIVTLMRSHVNYFFKKIS